MPTTEAKVEAEADGDINRDRDGEEDEEHHKWNVITWFFGSSPCFPLNFGMSNGDFTGMAGHEGLCRKGSLINLDK